MKHPLFDILGGHPLPISLISSLLINNFTLKDLFKLMYEQGLVSRLSSTDERSKEETLISCVEFAILVIQNRDPMVIEMFYTIGVNKDGLQEEEIISI
jgi:hypothetical protein